MDAAALQRFRALKDGFFASDVDSPLTPGQRARFRGLTYYPPSPALEVVTELKAYRRQSELELMTSAGDTQRYRRAGVVRFEVAGIPSVMTLFRSDDEELFAPFRDATSGTETYAAGRYLEARSLGRGNVLLDFNYAYNPYCAYNTGWRCPIPPSENHLLVPIRAGEKTYPDAERSEATAAR